ncbi:TPA: hypothetical protein NQI75_005369 [Pseudomonas aeruginosa]|nr:hypothetical protein [Pseudomonas aeruginosa]HCH7803207.1 hypothetical protein [Pseudomonas aeruginosa]HCI4168606.1 hypothetical protein [Pseudomonas aeruginosa]HCI7165011.1 hypothetical protein [Pseudomonas aeruginosa]HCJ0752207.1 hypothetical protein [Pseudomonas aeruginosa]
MATGASIYISEAELEALYDAQSYLSALLEGANEADHLVKTKAGLASIEEKVSKARKSAGKRSLVNAALRAAQDE